MDDQIQVESYIDIDNQQKLYLIIAFDAVSDEIKY